MDDPRARTRQRSISRDGTFEDRLLGHEPNRRPNMAQDCTELVRKGTDALPSVLYVRRPGGTLGGGVGGPSTVTARSCSKRPLGTSMQKSRLDS